MKNIAIVTGASSGLGKEFARILVSMKTIDEVWAIARSKDKLDALKEEFGEKIIPFSMDLSDFDKIKELESILKNESEKEPFVIRYLINNAGYDKFGSYADLSLEESMNMIHLNVNAVVAMGLICLPYMKKKSHLINIASQASFQPLPYQNIYASTKAFVRNYSRALNVELKDRGILVTAVCPGWIETGLYDRAEIGAQKSVRVFRSMAKPEEVAKKSMLDAKRGRDLSVYSYYTKFSHLVAKLLPQRLMMKLWLKQQNL